MTAPPPFTSPLAPVLTRLVALKRALGRSWDGERRILAHLDRFLTTPAADLTAATFTAWCATFVHLTPTVRRRWMGLVVTVGRYRRRTDPTCFVPDPLTFPRRHPPRRPYQFTPEDLDRLLGTAAALVPTAGAPRAGASLRLALVLLYTTGLRRGEVVRLTRGDYDAAAQTLRIQASKFHKPRLVPLSAATAGEIDAFLAGWAGPAAPSWPLLGHGRGGRRAYTGAGLAQGLRRLFRRADVRTPTGQLPHVHDLRHAFAHAALLRWYRAGVDVQAKLPALATYMGHVSIASTQHYLAPFAPVTAAASARFAAHCAPFLPPPEATP